MSSISRSFLRNREPYPRGKTNEAPVRLNDHEGRCEEEFHSKRRQNGHPSHPPHYRSKHGRQEYSLTTDLPGCDHGVDWVLCGRRLVHFDRSWSCFYSLGSLRSHPRKQVDLLCGVGRDEGDLWAGHTQLVGHHGWIGQGYFDFRWVCYRAQRPQILGQASIVQKFIHDSLSHACRRFQGWPHQCGPLPNGLSTKRCGLEENREISSQITT